MSMMRRTRLVASAAVSAGLAVSALSLAPASPASAATATATATYTCSNPALASVPVLGPLLAAGFTVPASFSVANLPDTIRENVPVPAGSTLTSNLQFPTSGGLAGILSSVGITVNSLLGGTALSPVSSTFSNGVATISDQLGTFTPSDGLPIPNTFDASLITSLLGPLAPLGVTCTYNPNSIVYPPGANPGGGSGGGGGGGSIGGLPISKQKAKINAHQIGKKSMLLVKVKNQTGKASGKVVAKLHGKKVGKGSLNKGKLRLKLKKLKHGVNRIKLTYAGDSITQAGHKNVRVKILGR